MAARCSVVVPEVTVPKFETEAVRNALEMSQYSVSELERLLRVNTKIAAENRLRFHDFCSEENRSMPAVCATRELFLNAFFRKIFQRRIFVMRKNIYVSLLSLWVASPAGRYQTLSFGRRCPFARKRWNIHV